MGNRGKQAALEIQLGEAKPMLFPMQSSRCAIGHSPFNDLTLPFDEVERRHGVFFVSGEAVGFEPLGGVAISLNGENTSRTVTLKEGDTLAIGQAALTLRFIERLPIFGEAQTARLKPKSGNASTCTVTWVEKGKEKSARFEQEAVIGSSKEADIRIDDEFISKKHCRLRLHSEGIELFDLMSTNGSWLNDVKLSHATLPAKANLTLGKTPVMLDGALFDNSESANQANDTGFIGEHEKMLELKRNIEQVAPLDAAILLIGETGAGKEVAARAIHERSGRANDPFVAVNCGAISAELIESELFGHEKGAFTGASAKRSGAFLAAKRGTIFLDEIGELPMTLQAKLLRAIDNFEIKPIGSDTVKTHKARLITATNRDINAMIEAGKFREDLFYRLSTLLLRVPALREHREDIPRLAAFFLESAGVKAQLTKAAQEALMYYYWAGNVRELKNVITASLCFHPEIQKTGIFDEEQIELTPRSALSPTLNALSTDTSGGHQSVYQGESLQEMEAHLIAEAIEHYGGNKQAASRALGISKSALYEKIKRYNLSL